MRHMVVINVYKLLWRAIFRDVCDIYLLACFAFLGPSGGAPVGTSTAPYPRPSLDDVSQLVFLRHRIRSLEKEILGV